MPHRSYRSVTVAALLALTSTMLAVPSAAASPAAAPSDVDAIVHFDPQHETGGDISRHFVGLSIEWSLAERYMGPSARPAFVHLLDNLGSGVLRMGGSSQDAMPFDPAAANTNRVITPEDLSYVRSTLDALDVGARSPGQAPPWGAVLGTAMSPRSDSRPFVSPDHARTFIKQGVGPAFAGATDEVAGIELGNEPDLTYHGNLDSYLSDLATYSAADVTGQWPIIAPNTSEDILPWQDIDSRSVPTRWFWDWPRILDTGAATMRARAGVFGAHASDHFYPLARTCRNKPYRCPSISELLSDRHMASLDYQAYVHARQAAQHGLGYRLEETNTAAGRGADGVSNTAASATYALDLMFHTACPQPPNDPATNADCGTGAIGLNFHNAEVRAFFHPEEGNAYYNAIDFDPSSAMGAPQATPLYYAMLLFSRFAQGGSGLRPVTVEHAGASQLKAWRVEGDASARRLFLVNKGKTPATVGITVPASSIQVDRMTPYDPTGAGRTLDAPQVRIDGRQVGADGVWPGFDPSTQPVVDGRTSVHLGPGEVAVVTMHGHGGDTRGTASYSLTPTQGVDTGKVTPNTQGFSVETADFAHGFLTRALLARRLKTLGEHGVLRIGGYSMDLVWPAFGQYADDPVPDQAIGGVVDQSDLDALKALLDASDWKVTIGVPLKSVIDPDQVRNPSKDPSPPVTLDQAVEEVRAAYRTLGDDLLAVEVGNEYDNVTTLNASQYHDQLKRYRAAIAAAVPGAPVRLAGPSANTATTNTKLDDFVTALRDDSSTTPAALLEELSSHYYPTSHCGSSTATIPQLMSAATYEKTRSKLRGIMQVGARLDGAVPMTINESNSASCSGQPGVSDAYATSLWSLDYLLQAAQGGIARLQFHTNTAAVCGDFKPRASDDYPISYRYYGAFCAEDQAALTGNQLQATPLYYGLWAFRQVPDGRFVRLGLTDGALSRLRAYGVESGDGTLTVVLINVQDPASALSTNDAVTVALPAPYDGNGSAVTLRSSAPGGLASTDASAITMGGRTVSPDGEALGQPEHTKIPVEGSAASITVAPGTARIVSFPNVQVPGSVDVTGMTTTTQPLTGGQPTPVTVSVANTTGTAQDVTVTVQVPDGWQAAPVTQQVPAHDSADLTVTVTPPLAPGEATLTAYAHAPGITGSGRASAGVFTAPAAGAVPLALDSGSVTSPLYGGYQRLSPDDGWDAAKGYGWVGTPPSDRDRGSIDALRRDFVLSRSPATLRIAVPAGQHEVYVLRGDAGYSSGDTIISEDGQVLADPGGTLPSGQFQWFHFTLDGGPDGRTANLTISGTGNNYWRIVAVTLLP